MYCELFHRIIEDDLGKKRESRYLRKELCIPCEISEEDVHKLTLVVTVSYHGITFEY
jgi:hypothetical protein